MRRMDIGSACVDIRPFQKMDVFVCMSISIRVFCLPATKCKIGSPGVSSHCD